MLPFTSDFQILSKYIVLYIGITVALRFYKYACIHYMLVILVIHQCATFFIADEVNIIY